MEPRQDQLSVVNKVIADITGGHSKVLIQAPTGWGKTLVLVMILDRLAGILGNQMRVTWVAHRDRLLLQAFLTLFAAAPHLLRNIVLINVSSPRIPRCTVLVVDEGHHDAAHSYHQVRENAAPQIVLAATATPMRSDGLLLHFSRIIVAPTLDSLIHDEILADFDHYALCGTSSPMDMVEAFMAEPVRWGQSLIFLPDCSLAHEATARLRAAGISAAPALGDANREAVTMAFTSGTLQVLLTVHALAEGVDVPGVRTVFIRDSMRTVVLQTIGRSLRRNGDKVAQVVQFANARVPFFTIATPRRRFAGTPGDWQLLPADPMWHEQTTLNRKHIAKRFSPPQPGKEST